MLWGFVLGIVGGLVAQWTLADTAVLDGFLRYVADPVGQIFLRLLFLLVIPLLVSALSLGIAGLGDLRRLGRVGLRTLAYTVCVSTIAVALGVTLVHLLRPGAGISDELRAELMAEASERTLAIAREAEAPTSGVDLLLNIIPVNPVRAMADGDMLAVMFFALMLGIGLAMTRTEGARRLTGALEGLFDVSMRLIDLVISFVPSASPRSSSR